MTEKAYDKIAEELRELTNLPNSHITDSFLKSLSILPNPALKGGELQVAAMQGAKQTIYVEQRRKHREAFQQSLVDCGCEKCLAILRDPAEEGGL